MQRYTFSRPAMGTAFNIIVYAPDSTVAHLVSDTAFERIDLLDRHLSTFLVDSEVSRLSLSAGTGDDVPVSDLLWPVLVEAQWMARQSKGAFDVTVGTLSRLWRRAMRRNQMPLQHELEKARNSVGYRHMHLNAQNQTVRLDCEDLRLDLGGIVKGFAANEALRIISSFGLSSTLVDAGGDIVLGDPPPGEEGWRITLSTVNSNGDLVQEDTLLSNTAIASSGDTYRFIEADGVRYSHIIDPRTGMAVSHISQVTVFAPTGIRADALASACSVLPPKEGLALVTGLPGTHARFILRTGDNHRLIQSPGYD